MDMHRYKSQKTKFLRRKGKSTRVVLGFPNIILETVSSRKYRKTSLICGSVQTNSRDKIRFKCYNNDEARSSILAQIILTSFTNKA